jgi:hypothetical protein
MRRLAAISFAVSLVLAAASALAQGSGKLWRLGILTTHGTGPGFETFYSITFPELAKQGFVEGGNLVVETRAGPPDKLPELARELVATRPDAIIAVTSFAIRAVQQASSTIPIVGHRLGSDHRRLCDKPCPAGRHCHRHRDARTRARREKAGCSARGCTRRPAHCGTSPQ